MVNNLQQRTAGECSQELLEALRSGSNERVQQALAGIADLTPDDARDSQELEFRDMLAGIAEPIARTAVASPASVQMLRHVAAQSAFAAAARR